MPVPITEVGRLPKQSNDGSKRFRARIIEGNIWGSSGFYSNQVLQEAARDRVFNAGKAVFFDHPGLTEQEDRPNRSVRDLAGKLVTDAVFESDGLYADVEFYPHAAPIVAAMAEDIGLSIRAMAEVEQGETAGRRGNIIARLTEAVSVDLVTRAGAGGRLVNLLESAAQGANQAVEAALTENQPPAEPEANPQVTPTPEPAPEPTPETPPAAPEVAPQDPAPEPSVADPSVGTAETTPTQEEKMPPEANSGSGGTAPPRTTLQAFEERIAAKDRELAEMRARDQARSIVAEDLALAILPPLVVQRLSEELLSSMPMNNGELDSVTLRDRIAAKRDRAELEIGEALSMMGGHGQVRGLGGAMVAEDTSRVDEFQSQAAKSLGIFGVSEEAAAKAVKGAR